MNDDTQYCTNCKRHVSRENYMIHTAHCARNITICEVCKEPVPIKEMSDHVTEMHSLIKCEKCNKRMEQWKLEDHEDSCMKRPINCVYCELSCPWDEIKDHESYCGARTEQCGECERFILMKDKANHMEQNCCKTLKKNYCHNCKLVIDSDMAVHQRLCNGSLDSVRRLLRAHAKDKESGTPDVKAMISQFSKLSTSEENARRNSNQNFTSKDEGNDFCDNCEKYVESDMILHQQLCKSPSKSRKKEEKGNFCVNCEKCIGSDMELHQRLCKKPVKAGEKDMINDNSIKNSKFKSRYVTEKGISSGTVPKWKLENEFNEEKEKETHVKEVSVNNFEDNRNRHPGRVNESVPSSRMECIIKCPLCKIGYPIHLLDDHTKACEKREEICVICSKVIPFSQIKIHQENCAKQRGSFPLLPGPKQSDTYLSEVSGNMFSSSNPFKQQVSTSDRHRHQAVSHKNSETCPVCQATLPTPQFRDHLTLCLDNAYQLRALIESRGALTHFGPEDGTRICSYCSIKLPLSEYDGHVLECGRRRTVCFICGKDILVCVYQDHIYKCVETAEKKEIAQTDDQPGTQILSRKQRRKMGRIAADFSSKIDKTHTVKKTDTPEPVYLPCEFCEKMIPEYLLIEHQSGCKPELLHYPQPTEEEYFSASESFDYGKNVKHKNKPESDKSGDRKKMKQEKQISKEDSDDDLVAPGAFLGQYKKEDVICMKSASSLTSAPEFIVPRVNTHQTSHSHTSSSFADIVKSEVHNLKSDNFKNRCKKVSIVKIIGDDDDSDNEDSFKNISEPEQKYNFEQFYGHSARLDFTKEQNISPSSASVIEALGYKYDNKFHNADLSKNELISDHAPDSIGNQKPEYMSVSHTLNQGARPKSQVSDSKKPTKSSKSKKHKKGRK